MQIIICDCGTELPFNERDLSSAAGQPFTCPICGKTRKLPLPNVFTPAAPVPRQPASSNQHRAGLSLIIIGAAAAFTLLLVLAGFEPAVRISGMLISISSAQQMLFCAVRRESPKTLAPQAIALLGGRMLSNPDWSTALGFTAVVIALVFQQSMEQRRQPDAPESVTEHWRLGTRSE